MQPRNTRLASGLPVALALALAGCSGDAGGDASIGGSTLGVDTSQQAAYLHHLAGARLIVGSARCSPSSGVNAGTRLIAINLPVDPPPGTYAIDPMVAAQPTPAGTATAELVTFVSGGGGTSRKATGGTIRIDTFTAGDARGHARIDFGQGDVAELDILAGACR